MWPWEHVIFGYLLYTVYTHVVHRESPKAVPTAVMAVAAVFPDLIDKPLAWEFGVFSTGYALGHSVFFVIPLTIVVWVFTHDTARSSIGTGFIIGYLSHLLGDVVPVNLRRGEIVIDHLFWPFMIERSIDHGSLGAGIGHYLDGYLTTVLTLEITLYVIVQLTLFFAAFALWLSDGMPPLRSAIVFAGSWIHGRFYAE